MDSNLKCDYTQKWGGINPIDLGKIKKYPFPNRKYFKQEHKKTQVLLHHTVSGPNLKGDVNTWINSKYKIGTCIIIARDGTPYQLFSSKYWAYHIGAGDHDQDRRSIGIEFDNWGGLKKGNDFGLEFFRPQNSWFGFMKINPKRTNKKNFHTIYGNSVDVPTQHYPAGFRGFKYYEKYTDAQIQTAGELLLYWNKRYGIPLDYQRGMWNRSENARLGKPGIWTHVSFRTNKSDCHPQPELINMLKTLKYL